MDDSIVVVEDYSPSKQLCVQRQIPRRNRMANPSSSSDAMFNKRKQMANASLTGRISSKVKLDDSVIIIEDDDDLALTRRQFDSTLIILDSDEEGEVLMVTDGVPDTKHVNTKGKKPPAASNYTGKCPLEFVNPASHVSVPATARGQRFQKLATSAASEKQTPVHGTVVTAGAVTRSVTVSRDASAVFADSDARKQLHREKTPSPNKKRTVITPPKSANMIFSKASKGSGSQLVWTAQRKVLFNAEAQKGGLLTATLDFTKKYGGKNIHSSPSSIEKGSKSKKSRQHGLDDSFRQLLGISKNSKRWQNKNKNKKSRRKQSKQQSEADLSKVVLGIRNLSSESNMGTDVIQFTSGKSPASNLVSRNYVSTNGVEALSMSPKRPLVNINDGQGVNIGVIDVNMGGQTTGATASENVAPSAIQKVDATEPDVVVIGSAVNRKVAMINPSQNKGLAVNNSTNTKLSPLKMPTDVNVWKPPPSPQTLLHNGHIYNTAPIVQPGLSMQQQQLNSILLQRHPTMLAPLFQMPLHIPLHLPLQMPGPRSPSLKLRPIAIDGSNVAFSHGKGRYFSCRGIQLCIEFFRKRGHNVKAFVPQFRRCKSSLIRNQEILEKMSTGENQTIVFTPSRTVNNCTIASYDDRFIVEYAVQSGAVMVSNDNYRDIMKESPAFRLAIEKRLLMYTFVDDLFMVPHDPLGRHGPSLDTFLSFSP